MEQSTKRGAGRRTRVVLATVVLGAALGVQALVITRETPVVPAPDIEATRPPDIEATVVDIAALVAEDRWLAELDAAEIENIDAPVLIVDGLRLEAPWADATWDLDAPLLAPPVPQSDGSLLVVTTTGPDEATIAWLGADGTREQILTTTADAVIGTISDGGVAQPNIATVAPGPDAPVDAVVVEGWNRGGRAHVLSLGAVPRPTAAWPGVYGLTTWGPDGLTVTRQSPVLQGPWSQEQTRTLQPVAATLADGALLVLATDVDGERRPRLLRYDDPAGGAPTLSWTEVPLDGATVAGRAPALTTWGSRMLLSWAGGPSLLHDPIADGWIRIDTDAQLVFAPTLLPTIGFAALPPIAQIVSNGATYHGMGTDWGFPEVGRFDLVVARRDGGIELATSPSAQHATVSGPAPDLEITPMQRLVLDPTTRTWRAVPFVPGPRAALPPNEIDFGGGHSWVGVRVNASGEREMLVDETQFVGFVSPDPDQFGGNTIRSRILGENGEPILRYEPGWEASVSAYLEAGPTRLLLGGAHEWEWLVLLDELGGEVATIREGPGTTTVSSLLSSDGTTLVQLARTGTWDGPLEVQVRTGLPEATALTAVIPVPTDGGYQHISVTERWLAVSGLGVQGLLYDRDAQRWSRLAAPGILAFPDP